MIGPASDIDEEDVIPFDVGEQTFAIYRTRNGFYATDGLCTHEEQHLGEGFVDGDFIECPMHQGRFHIPTGEARSAPVCVNLKTYPVKNVDGILYLKV